MFSSSSLSLTFRMTKGTHHETSYTSNHWYWGHPGHPEHPTKKTTILTTPPAKKTKKKHGIRLSAPPPPAELPAWMIHCTCLPLSIWHFHWHQTRPGNSYPYQWWHLQCTTFFPPAVNIGTPQDNFCLCAMLGWVVSTPFKAVEMIQSHTYAIKTLKLCYN